ncbi:hypothetical protein AK88_04252 [Plasmodium fragile]|uniref:Uncharacterized protein n=1 Tax=Plasmodium fragile TaxID=5857 RepID=A0A0D9QGK3_PLAFR|nr:uncharacterized protein AK88_04252 [Plasmodium fragile]KJP86129.1 hypothetical protein AK88_04252 [Plasmodium fragile]
MSVVKHIFEHDQVRLLNNIGKFAETLSSLGSVPSIKKFIFAKYGTNYNRVIENYRNSSVLVFRANEYLRKLIESISVVFWKGRKWKGTYWPSKWKWYHRHGYWATRKKLLSFDKYRPYRYHEVKGHGKPKLQFWQDHSYYRPLKQTTKFW